MKKVFLFLCLAGLPGLLAAKESKKKKKSGETSLTMQDIWASGKYAQQGLYGVQMLKDGKYCMAGYDAAHQSSVVVRYDFERKEPLDTMFNSAFAPGFPAGFMMEGFEVSPENNYLLIQGNSKSVYRHSQQSQYYIFSLRKNKTKPLFKGEHVSDATFSPDESKIAFVYKNNIYVSLFKTADDQVVQLTNDGAMNKVINGMADWVYEEEFALKHAFDWSPASDKVAYLKFDESRVKEYALVRYDRDSTYPAQMRYKYPKVGEANSTVSVWVYDLNARKNTKMIVNEEKDQYIPRIKWTRDNNLLSIQRLNRRQNHFELLFADAQTGKARPVYEEENNTYIEITDNLYFLKDNSFILATERTGQFMSLFRIDKDGNVLANLTNQPSDVEQLIAVDEEKGKVYYSAHEPTPLFTYIYQVGLDGIGKQPLVDGQRGTNSAVFSPDFRYFLLTSTKMMSPAVVQVYKTEGFLIRDALDNQALRDRIKELAPSPKEELKIPIAGGMELNGWIIKPKDFRESRQYPVLFYVYGGPGHNTVKNEWGGAYDFWFQYLADQGYIVVSVDNRGTGNRGADFKRATYKNLGTLESDDQIAAARYMAANYKWVDKDRIGIFGWSFGGYMSLMCLSKGADVFKTAVAVAPVTDWRYYDNIYTERYMQTTAENKEGYENTSVFKYLPQMKGNLLLIHGTMDDNVHPQNSYELIEKMVEMNKKFDSEFYVNKNHGIYGGATRLHIFNRITDYILLNL